MFALRLLIVIFLTEKGHCACAVDEFECNNDNCISASLINNTVNDCEDNSDEGFQWECPRNGEFKCTQGVGDAGLCFAGSYRLDGIGDCPDRSDEEKYVGTVCNQYNGACCPCEDFIDESECSDEDVCVCKSGRYSNELGTNCIVRILGDECTTDPDCYDAVDDSVCDGGICLCQTGWYASSDNYTSDTYCIKRELYDDCGNNVDCSAVISNSNCTNQICLCNSGYKGSDDNTTCSRRQIGDDCILDTDCFHSVSHSECADEDGDNTTTTTCQCEYFYRPSDDLYDCLTYRLEDTCENDTQCDFGVNHSNCTEDMCQCDSGYQGNYVTYARCNLRQIYDETCVVSTDCSDAVNNSHCAANNTCLCNTGYYPSDNLLDCIETYIGDVCNSDEDCTTFVNNSLCSNDVCECTAGYQVTHSNQSCILRELGDTCEIESDCSEAITNSNCTGGICSCLDTYYDVDNSTCELRLLNTTCDINSDCNVTISNSYCDGDDTCQCLFGYYGVTNDSDCMQRTIYGYCETFSDCSEPIQNSTCVANECICDDGFYPNDANTTCIQRYLGDACTTNIQCNGSIESSICFEEECICELGYNALNNLTCQARIVGDECTIQSDCSAIDGQYECSGNFCACATGYKSSENGSVCNKRRIGDVCNVSADCQLTSHSTCDGGLCACADGYQAIIDELVSAAENETVYTCTLRRVGENCSSDADCSAINNTHCLFDDVGDAVGECACVSGLLPNPANTNCFDFQIGLSNCTMDDDCLGEANNSYCSANLICLCADTYVADENAISCLVPVVGGGDVTGLTCDTSQYCLSHIDNTECESGSCVCSSGYTPSDDYTACERVVAPTSAPVTTEECNFICKYPWAIAIMALFVVALAVLTIALFIKKPSLAPAAVKKKAKIVPVNTYKEKPPLVVPAWPRAPGFQIMYADDIMKAPEVDIDDGSGLFVKHADGLMFSSMNDIDKQIPPVEHVMPPLRLTDASLAPPSNGHLQHFTTSSSDA